MKQQILFFILIALVMTTGANAQNQQHSLTCGYDHVSNQFTAKHNGTNISLKDNVNAAVKTFKSQSNSSDVYQIPVVFHVLYNTEDQNLGDEVFEDQIEILTEDYRRFNENASETREIFQDIAADVGIEFYLATEDPNGNPTNGINRVYTDRTGFELNLFSQEITLDEVKFAETGGTPSWGIEYLNIWVCNIEEGFLGQIFGFAYPPNGADNWEDFPGVIGDDVTGVVVHYPVVGSNNPTAGDDGVELNNGGRTLTHEVGHFFGLRHIWGDGFSDCSTDDGISDTPTAANGANFECNYNIDDCTIDDLPNMIENYMDYNTDDCYNMFTEEQSDVMRFNLVNYRPELIADVTTNVAELQQASFSIYPNPSQGVLYIEGGQSWKNEQLQIWNQMGQVVHTDILKFDTQSIEVDLPSGVYWIKLGTAAPQRFIRY